MVSPPNSSTLPVLLTSSLGLRLVPIEVQYSLVINPGMSFWGFDLCCAGYRIPNGQGLQVALFPSSAFLLTPRHHILRAD
ncbi:hypothetical protein G7K_6287-t1 [Saitoella complicata NRRL Y-17804]|uniref:Uncharacterized protein n=1 Tax=Saitoella complicata (strain BCRC 22490 / CBS 7301 / JCM 7358 / NBRC 10748 / NRRL Y-17804) TaxID=698492 RepID=A0A0E9NQS8_SAICN|nr:hypothetical protein G7K_6287-t1 [Saitoella complicata NRRL Y-17804]